jgi:hypothetical protein
MEATGQQQLVQPCNSYQCKNNTKIVILYLGPLKKCNNKKKYVILFYLASDIIFKSLILLIDVWKLYLDCLLTWVVQAKLCLGINERLRCHHCIVA